MSAVNQVFISASNELGAFESRDVRWRDEGDGLDLPYPDWLPRLQEFRPSVVLFAHDLPMWTTAS